jgi:hypothetical protein
MPFTIGNHSFNRISGPVSLTVLKPIDQHIAIDGTNSKISVGNKGALPAVMLFGDIHRKAELCGECRDDDECIEISSYNFLQKIDSLSTPEHPVDFYIEGADFSDFTKSEKFNGVEYTYTNESMIPKIREKIQTCYFKEFRNTQTYKKECPTKHIRWHYSDGRFIHKSYESVIVIFLRIFGAEGNKTFKEIIEKLYNTSNGYAYTKEDVVFYLKLTATIFENPFNFVNIVFDLNNPYFVNFSSIYKQIRKMQAPYNNFGVWKDWFQTYYEDRLFNLEKTFNYTYEYYGDKKINSSKINKEELRRLHFLKVSNFIKKRIIPLVEQNQIDEADSFITTELQLINKLNVRMLVLFRLYLPEFFLDMYFITRIFKQPENATSSFLTLGYFGIDHCENISYFLTNICKLFQIVFEEQNEIDLKINQCLDLQHLTFNFNKDVFDFNKFTNSYNPNYLTVDQFRERITNFYKNSKKREEKYLQKKQQTKKSPYEIILANTLPQQHHLEKKINNTFFSSLPPTTSLSQIPSNTKSQTQLPTPSQIPSNTKSQTQLPTPSQTPSNTKSQTQLPTPSQIPSNTKLQTQLPSQSQIPSNTKSQTQLPTKSQLFYTDSSPFYYSAFFHSDSSPSSSSYSSPSSSSYSSPSSSSYSSPSSSSYSSPSSSSYSSPSSSSYSSPSSSSYSSPSSSSYSSPSSSSYSSPSSYSSFRYKQPKLKTLKQKPQIHKKTRSIRKPATKKYTSYRKTRKPTRKSARRR